LFVFFCIIVCPELNCRYKSLARDLGVPQSHETRIHNIALENEIIMICVLLSHETRIHNIALESVSIMIGVLLGEYFDKLFNDSSTQDLDDLTIQR